MELLESFIIGRRLSLRQAPVNWETSCAPAYNRGAFMPITPYLDGALFEPETRRVMGVAFEMARAALRLEDRADPVVAILAHKIIELAKGGEFSPDLLCERALNDLRAPPPHV
jgi:hypothetical protein